MEPLIRPCDRGFETFDELTAHFRGVLLDILKTIPADLIGLMTEFVVWLGPRLYMNVDVYWPRDRKLYKGIVMKCSSDRKRFEVRYTGWTERWNEWVDVNYHDFDAKDGKAMGRIFPEEYRTCETRVGSAMCSRSRRANVAMKKKRMAVFKIGMWVVVHDNRDHNFLARIIKLDRDCHPMGVKVDRGQMNCEWTTEQHLWILQNPPPTGWLCMCGGIGMKTLWCEVCGAMWKGL